MGVKLNPFTGKLDVVDSPSGDFSTVELNRGTEGSPSIAFDSDSNTGIYSPGADQVAISTNGTGRLFVDANGNVGVGRTPLTVLHVNGDIRAENSRFLSGRGTEQAPAYRFHDDGDSGLWSPGINEVALSTGGSERLRITSDGKLGLGTSSPGTPMEIRKDWIGQIVDSLTLNNLGGGVNEGSAIVFASGGASGAKIIGSRDGSTGHRIRFQTAPTHNGTPADRLTITKDGRVGIGTTSPSTKLHVEDGNNTVVTLGNTSYDNGAVQYFNGSLLLKAAASTGDKTFQVYTAGSERARIDSSGRLLVGTTTARSRFFNTSNTSSPVQIEGNSTSTSSLSIIRNENGADSPNLLLAKSRGTAYEVLQYVNGTSSDDAIGGISFQGADGSDFVQAAQIRCHVDGTPGANDMPGRLVFSTTADGSSSSTERMRITSDGYVTNKTSGIGTVGGAGFSLSDFIITTRVDGVPAFFNRETTDGTIVSIRQDGAEEGTISVSGTTVSYNGAHLSRWSQLPSGAERTEILRGSVLSNIDEMCEWGDEDNEQLNRMKVSDVQGDKNVSGVFQAWDDDDDTYTNDFYCAMTGDFIIRIAQGVTVERGDLLMSAGDGTAKPQDDDIIRSKTIAKVTSTHVSETYADGSYCVPCVLMAC